MPRQAKWVAAGIYQPAYTPRHAYGPRRRGRMELVEEFLQTPCDVLDAQTAARYGRGLGQLNQVIAVKMPRGGVRYLLICPRCKGHSMHLYGRYHPFFRALEYACRTCWGLRYQSQYAGRRPEAHPDYLAMLTRRQTDKAPRDAGYTPYASPRRTVQGYTHRRRMACYRAAEETHKRRTQRHTDRKDLAQDLALVILLGRCEAQQNRRWLKILRTVLWHGHKDTMQELIAMRDTPKWARKVLRDVLQSDTFGAKEAKTRRETVQKALETDKNGHLASIVEQERLDEMRAAYAALGQARRAKRVA